MKIQKIFASVLAFSAILSQSVFGAPETVLITGRGIGITLNSDGAMVEDTTDIETKDGKTVSPAKDCGIRKGDIITKVGGAEINSVDDLHKILSEAGNTPLLIEINRNGSPITTRIKPAEAGDGNYRLGIWAKDAAAGIGTLTFYDPETGNFGALGHGITDTASGSLIEIEGGEVLPSTIVSVQKGRAGEPGELQGIFGVEGQVLGEITKNTNCGIFGNMTLPEEEISKAQSIKIGSKADARVGKAYILANIEGSKTEKFEIEIMKIPAFTGDVTKGLVIRVTDHKLLEKTGGIVRGMSGSPIVQSGRLIGAVTHVFVNDPTSGYGIFIEDMVAQLETETALQY